MFKVKNKNTRTTSITLFWCFYCSLWTYCTPISRFSIVNFEQINVSGASFFRSFIYPFCIVGGKPTPIYAFLLAFLFCTVNGYMQARSALLLSSYSENDLPRIVIGTFLFLLGFLINQHSDHVLKNLRKPGETGYKIPKGKWYQGSFI